VNENSEKWFNEVCLKGQRHFSSNKQLQQANAMGMRLMCSRGFEADMALLVSVDVNHFLQS